MKPHERREMYPCTTTIKARFPIFFELILAILFSQCYFHGDSFAIQSSLEQARQGFSEDTRGTRLKICFKMLKIVGRF